MKQEYDSFDNDRGAGDSAQEDDSLRIGSQDEDEDHEPESSRNESRQIKTENEESEDETPLVSID